jgi:hypothetical protein
MLMSMNQRMNQVTAVKYGHGHGKDEDFCSPSLLLPLSDLTELYLEITMKLKITFLADEEAILFNS